MQNVRRGPWKIWFSEWPGNGVIRGDYFCSEKHNYSLQMQTVPATATANLHKSIYVLCRFWKMCRFSRCMHFSRTVSHLLISGPADKSVNLFIPFHLTTSRTSFVRPSSTPARVSAQKYLYFLHIAFCQKSAQNLHILKICTFCEKSHFWGPCVPK